MNSHHLSTAGYCPHRRLVGDRAPCALWIVICMKSWSEALDSTAELLNLRDGHTKSMPCHNHHGALQALQHTLPELQALKKPMPHNFSASPISLGCFTKINSSCKADGNDMKMKPCAGENENHSFSLKSSIYWHYKDMAWEANLFHIIYCQYSSKDEFWGSRKNFILPSPVIQHCWSCPHTNQWWHIFSMSGAKIIFKSIAGNCHCCYSKPLLFPLFCYHWCNSTSGLILQLLN